jgi:hypothetical protein
LNWLASYEIVFSCLRNLRLERRRITVTLLDHKTELHIRKVNLAISIPYSTVQFLSTTTEIQHIAASPITKTSIDNLIDPLAAKRLGSRTALNN